MSITIKQAHDLKEKDVLQYSGSTKSVQNLLTSSLKKGVRLKNYAIKKPKDNTNWACSCNYIEKPGTSHWNRIMKPERFDRTVICFWSSKGTIHNINTSDWTFDKDATNKLKVQDKTKSEAQKKAYARTRDKRLTISAKKQMPRLLKHYGKNVEDARHWGQRRVDKVLNNLPVWKKFEVLAALTKRERAMLNLFSMTWDQLLDKMVEEPDENTSKV